MGRLVPTCYPAVITQSWFGVSRICDYQATSDPVITISPKLKSKIVNIGMKLCPLSWHCKFIHDVWGIPHSVKSQVESENPAKEPNIHKKK